MFSPLPSHPPCRTRQRDLGAAVRTRILAPLAAGTALLACCAAGAQELPAGLGVRQAPVATAVPARQAPELVLEPVGPASLGLPSPVAPAGSPGASTRKPRRFIEFDQHFDAARQPGAAPQTIVLGQRDDFRIIIPTELRPSEAFKTELREKTLDSSRAQLYANLPYDMPELLEDDYILRQRSRVAESVMGSAVEKALVVAFQGGVRHESSVSIRPMFATVDHGFKVDASPSWSYKVRSARTGLRFDLPLTPRPLRVQAWRDLRGTDRTPFRLGGGITVDPFDQTVRCGISLEF